MTDVRIPGIKAERFLMDKFKIDYAQACYILLGFQRYKLPTGDELASGESPHQILSMFFNDVSIYRYEFKEEDRIIEGRFVNSLMNMCLLFEIWKNNQEDSNYPYKLNAFRFSADNGAHAMLVSEAFEADDLTDCYFLKTELDVIAEVFGIEGVEEEDEAG